LNQLALPLTLDDHAVFESYLASGNEDLVAYLESLADDARGPGCWLWGARATGKSHLLQALAERFGDESAYLPLALVAEAGPAVLDDLAQRRCVCLDEIERIAGRRPFELGLFDLCNQLADRDGMLVIAAAAPPRDSGIALPDLLSRLSRLPVFQVEALNEQGRIEALQLRAAHRGLELPIETARYLLARHRRDMASLYGLLDRLDREALKAQRRLTVPFVRGFLHPAGY
jgi:DnaA-homolog protein